MRKGLVGGLTALLAATPFSMEARSPDRAEDEAPTDAVPMTQPVPSYPVMAFWLGLQGRCDVRFDVGRDGWPLNLDTCCSEPVFCYQSKKAVLAVQFKPKIKDGTTAVRRNVVYPIEYTLVNGSELGEVTLAPCSNRASA